MSDAVERHYRNWHLFGGEKDLTIVYQKRDDCSTSISIPWDEFEKFIAETVEKFDA